MILLIVIIVLLFIFLNKGDSLTKSTGRTGGLTGRPSTPESIGKSGEKYVTRKLDCLPKEYITLNDVLLPGQYGTTQIDHIVVSPYGIFVIETKNYKGYIFGHEDSEYWTQSLAGKRSFGSWSSEQHKLRNPIRQNLSHFHTVRRVLSGLGDFTIIPIVVFSDSAELNITAPHHTVINWRNLHPTIKRYTTLHIKPEKIQLIVEKITSTNITSEANRVAHIHKVQNIQKNTQLSIANKKCPKCGGNLVERRGQYGPFLGCSNYPRCRFTHKE